MLIILFMLTIIPLFIWLYYIEKAQEIKYNYSHYIRFGEYDGLDNKNKIIKKFINDEYHIRKIVTIWGWITFIPAVILGLFFYIFVINGTGVSL